MKTNLSLDLLISQAIDATGADAPKLRRFHPLLTRRLTLDVIEIASAKIAKGSRDRDLIIAHTLNQLKQERRSGSILGIIAFAAISAFVRVIVTHLLERLLNRDTQDDNVLREYPE